MEDCVSVIQLPKEDDKEHVFLENHPELINPYLKVEDIKKLIKNITGIDENRQKLQLQFDCDSITYNDDFFWNKATINIYDNLEYKYKIQRKGYKKDIILNLNKSIGELKKIVSNLTKIPIEIQEFYLNNKILSNDSYLDNRSLFIDKFDIRIPEKNELIKVKYPNSEIKEINIDLCNTAYECLNQIKNDTDNFLMRYTMNYNNKNLILDDMLICSGIKKDDLIEIIDKKGFYINIKWLIGKIIRLYIASTDKIKNIKYLIESKEGTEINRQRLFLNGEELRDDDKTVEEYNIKNETTLLLVKKLL